jgi:hypothetical protein
MTFEPPESLTNAPPEPNTSNTKWWKRKVKWLPVWAWIAVVVVVFGVVSATAGDDTEQPTTAAADPGLSSTAGGETAQPTTAAADSSPSATVDTTVLATVASTEAPTTTIAPTGNEESTNCSMNQDFQDDDGDGFGECVDRLVAIDAESALAQARFGGLPEGASCNIPADIVEGSSEAVTCPVANFDGSEGVWSFTVDSASTVSSQSYSETKAAPLTRDNCQETPPEGQFQKDSTSSLSRCLHFWAYIFQFDANTGPCKFLAWYGSSPHRRNYEFSDAIIRVDGEDRCDLLGPIVEGTTVEVWAVNNGTQSYDTTAGGSNTYTQFSVVDITEYG